MAPPKKRKERNRKPVDVARGKTNLIVSSEAFDTGPPPNHGSSINLTSPVPQTNLFNKCQSTTAVVDKASTDSDCVGEQKYSRRSIINNWKRYEENEVDEESVEDSATIRGQDFFSSLAVTDGVSYQFRFCDELEWENNSDSDLLSEFQKLNLEELAFSLSCIPLQERLDVAVGIFQSDQTTEFEGEAHANRMEFQKRKHREHTSKQNTEIFSQPLLTCDVKQPDYHPVVMVKEENLDKMAAEVMSLGDAVAKVNVEKVHNLKITSEEFEDELEYLLEISEKEQINLQRPTSLLSQSLTVLDLTRANGSNPETGLGTSKPEFQLQKQSLDDDWLDTFLED